MAGSRGGTSKSTLAAIAKGYASARQERNARSQSRGFTSYSQQGRLGYHADKREGKTVETFHITGTPKQRRAKYEEVKEIIARKGGRTQPKVRVEGEDWKSLKSVRSNELPELYASMNDYLRWLKAKYPKKFQKDHYDWEDDDEADDEDDDEQGELFLTQYDEAS